ncbi:peptidylprolyl isomerase [Prosthecobacter sp.]|uniref:peptidylprolyl isomerase n=1 Tax=Prosthecobacter sp. TaxID=1965333 RepID=UPI003784D370
MKPQLSHGAMRALACLLWLFSTLALAEERPVATVDGVPIMPADLRAEIRKQEAKILLDHPAEPGKREEEIAAMKRTVLDTVIDQQLLLNEFKRLGGVIKPEWVDEDVTDVIKTSFKGDRDAFMASLERDGVTLSEFRAETERKIKLVMMNRRTIGEKSRVTDEEVRAYYEKEKQGLTRPSEVKIQTVMVRKPTPDARSVAEGLRKRILEGADFTAIARAFSQDSYAQNGGDWGWMYLNDLAEDLYPVVAKMKKGEVSGLIEQPGAWVIVRLTDLKDMLVPDFDALKEALQSMAEIEKARQIVAQEIQNLRKAAVIEKMEAP